MPGSDSFKTLNVKFVVRAQLRIVDMSHLLKTYEGKKCDIFRLSVQNVCKRCLNLEKIYFQQQLKNTHKTSSFLLTSVVLNSQMLLH